MCMRLEVKSLFSIDLGEGELPGSPECCCVNIWADIGIQGKEGADQFNFYVITPAYLMTHPEVRWGRGYLLMPEFSWKEIKRMLERLVSSISASSWEEAAAKLCNYLEWEFENYQPSNR
jgi:hypothetical protein